MNGARSYRELITVERREVTNSRGGQPVESWLKFGKRRASIEPAGNTRSEQNKQPVHTDDYKVTIPMDSLIVAKSAENLRIIWHVRNTNLTLNVRTINVGQTGRGAELVMMVRKDR